MRKVARLRGGEAPHLRAFSVGLLGIAVLFVAQALIATLWRSHIDSEGRELARRAMDSVDDVARIRGDVEHEHALVEEHILAKRPADMAGIEVKLKRTNDDLNEGSRAYVRLLDSPEEAATWSFTQARIARIQQSLGPVLALSRGNLDAAADAKLAELERDYTAFEQAIDELIAINRRYVRAVLDKGSSLEAKARMIVLATQLAGLGGLMLIGLWGVRRVAEEQRQLVRVLSLEERNRELDAFAGRVAHDLRNPLGTIILTTDQLDQHGNYAGEIERLRRGSRRIQQLIDDLLALSRASGELAEATCNPSVVAARISHDFRDRFGRDADLSCDVEPSTIPYSETLFAQAVWNLVDNAVKYRRETVRPQVQVTGRHAGDRYELVVADNACGMSEPEAARAFDPFYRAGHARDVVGTGLGLSIVKRVVEARGGTVSMSSRPDEGSTFVLSLPIGSTRTWRARASGQQPAHASNSYSHAP
jgi:signal transduction histidine kinase